MGLLGFLKSTPPEPEFPATLGAPARGTLVAMDDIPDPVFSSGVLGVCCGVEPAEGRVYAPADCKVAQLAGTLHALNLEAGGADILIHVGVDTVNMKGDGFSGKVKEGQIVKKGGLLLTMDLDKIKAAGYPCVVIMAVTNADDLASVKCIGAGAVTPGDGVLRLER